jgi:cytochrome c peroxidase
MAAAFPDSTGSVQSVSTQALVDPGGPFFTSLGTNGRTCATCHAADEAFSVTPAHIQKVFDATQGTDPLFASVDGTNSPNAPLDTQGNRSSATSMLRSQGVFRVELPVPSNGEFVVSVAFDPYGYVPSSLPAHLSLFRRPRPTSNLAFISGVMWDGRESAAGHSLSADLDQQSQDATLGHAQAAVPGLTPDEETAIVQFESSLFSAQVVDTGAGSLTGSGGQGGPAALEAQPFSIGINDFMGADPAGKAFDQKVFTLYSAWSAGTLSFAETPTASVARGEEIFNTRAFAVTGVNGFNDVLKQQTVQATCSSCHDAPNAGSHSVFLPMDVGAADQTSDPAMNISGLPVYTLHNLSTGELRTVTDPGRGMITGKWADVGKFNVPVLRGLSARPPYFHNGAAATLTNVVDFYDTRFSIGFTPQEKADLAAFLSCL